MIYDCIFVWNLFNNRAYYKEVLFLWWHHYERMNLNTKSVDRCLDRIFIFLLKISNLIDTLWVDSIGLREGTEQNLLSDFDLAWSLKIWSLGASIRHLNPKNIYLNYRVHSPGAGTDVFCNFTECIWGSSSEQKNKFRLPRQTKGQWCFKECVN